MEFNMQFYWSSDVSSPSIEITERTVTENMTKNLCAVGLHGQRPSSLSTSKVSHVAVNWKFLGTKRQLVNFTL